MLENIFSRWKNQITDFVNVRIRLFKLGLIEQGARLAGYFFLSLIILFFLFVVLILLGLALGEIYSVWIGSRAGGYAAAAGTVLLLMLIFLLFRKPFCNGIASIIVRSTTSADEDEDEDDES